MTQPLLTALVWQSTFPPAASILFGCGFTVAACIGVGSRVLGSAVKDWAVRMVVGGAVLSLTVFAICCVGAAYPAVFAGIGVAAIAAGWRFRPRVRFGRPRGLYLIFAAAFAVYFVVYLLHAMAPEVSPDGAGYHLGFVARYFREHGFHRIDWNMYASLPEGLEMLFLFAFSFGRHSSAALVHLAFLVALVWQMVDWGRRSGYAMAGTAAALLVFASPLAGIDGSSAYNDIALAAVAFTLFNLLERWVLERTSRLLVAIGLTAGFAFSIKYTGWVAGLYAASYVGWKSRSWRGVAVVAGGCAVVVLPWLIKNWMWVQNPVAPFFNHWFPNQYVTAAFEMSYRHDLSLYDLKSRWQIPLEVTVRGGLGGVLGPVFLLSPLALLALWRPHGRGLLLAGLVFGINYFDNISPRFLLAAVPFVALAMGVGLSFAPQAFAVLALIHAVISWPTVVPRYTMEHAWRLPHVTLRDALRVKPEAQFLERNLYFSNEMDMIERSTPAAATVFTYRPLPDAYTSRKILVFYESEPNQIPGLIFRTAYDPGLQPFWQLHFAFERTQLRAIRLVQTAAGAQQWNIHELRVFDGPIEVPRSGWMVTASPYPFGIGQAFDGNLVTMWRSGESLAPGQEVEAEFPEARFADAVVMQAEPDQPDLRLELMGQLNDGRWIRLAERGTASASAEHPDLRCAAARELKRRGIDYILAWNDEAETANLRHDPDAWCSTQVSETTDAKLYKLP